MLHGLVLKGKVAGLHEGKAGLVYMCLMQQWRPADTRTSINVFSSPQLNPFPRPPHPRGNPDDKIHWFSITNSTMIVFFLAGMVAMILVRALHRDISRYGGTKSSHQLGRFRSCHSTLI